MTQNSRAPAVIATDQYLRCPYCGKRKRRGAKPSKQYVCRECQRIIDAAGATVRAWSKDFDDRAAWLFIKRAGQWVRLTRELGCSAADATACVSLLKRRGFIFESDPHRGRRLLGWTRWPQCETDSAERKTDGES